MSKTTSAMIGYFTSRKLMMILMVVLGAAVYMVYRMRPQFVQVISSRLLSCQEDGDNMIRRKDIIDNSGAKKYLTRYQWLYNRDKKDPVPQADPNDPKTIRTWWQAAAMIDWYINGPLRHNCSKKVAYGNWDVCQDEPWAVKPPCLVYSFGINWDFHFDDAMGKLGCEVHSFDPSMGKADHKRSQNITFHNMGLCDTNTNDYVARRDVYVRKREVWKMRTLKSVMRELGHENHVIDVLKIDIEAYEWAVLDNLIETDVLKYVRQFDLEFHLFPPFPPKADYVHLYQVYTRFREMGFREFSVGPHRKNLIPAKFNNQGDSEYINAFFQRQKNWR